VPVIFTCSLNRGEGNGEKLVCVEYGLRVPEFPCSFPHPLYPGSGLFDKSDPVVEVSDNRVSSDTFMSEVSLLHSWGESSRTADFNTVREDLNKDVCSFDEPVPVHDSIGYGFTERSCRIFGDLISAKALDIVREPGISLYKPKTLFNVRNCTVSEIFPVQDMDIGCALKEDAGDISLVKEFPWRELGQMMLGNPDPIV
jgi:hypothetical protein